MEKILQGLWPGAALLPKECLNISEEEWNEVKLIVDQEKTDQLKKLESIKEEIFGTKKLREADMKLFLREFQDMYKHAY